MSLESLSKRLPSSHECRKWDSYYNGEHRLDALGVTLPPAVRVLEMIMPWPKMAVDVLAEVLIPDGFNLATDDEAEVSDLLRRWWKINRLDAAFRLAATDTLVNAASYWIIGPGDDDAPRITAHPREGMAVERDHMGQVAEALASFRLGPGKDDRRLAHYLPYQTIYYAPSRAGRWVEVPEMRIEHPSAKPPVVPMVNRLRLTDHGGRSEMAEILDLANAASRSLTNLQVAQELLAMPRAWIFGKGAGSGFKGPDGEERSKLDAYLGYLNTGPENGKITQLAGADLTQIINSVKLYAQTVSSVTGIPPSMLGIATDNPASAEAMRVAKDRLIMRAEAKQSMFGDSLEEVMRIGLVMQGKAFEGIATLETAWRNVAAPSESAQQSLMLQAQAQGIISAATARDFLRLTPEQRARENQGDANATRLMGGVTTTTSRTG